MKTSSSWLRTKEESSRQSHLTPTIQHSILSLFKCLSNKLGVLLDGYLISRNDHCQDGYSLSLEKPFKEVKYLVKTIYTKMVRMETLTHFLPRQARGPVEWVKIKGLFTPTVNLLLTSTERQECIFWPIFQKTFRFESVGIFPITS